MQETESLLLEGAELAPVLERRAQQAVRADHVGRDEHRGAEDGAVDVRLGGEVDDCIGAVVGQQGADERRVADVAVHEHVLRIGTQVAQVFEAAGVGEQVEVDYAGPA